MLDINVRKKAIKHLFISIFLLLFGVIYELNSHGVYSGYMMFAFIIPLVFGAMTYLLIYKLKINRYLSAFAMNIYDCSVITLAVGSIMMGVLQIYGTTNIKIITYLVIGIILLIISIILNIKYYFKRKEGINL